MEIYKKNANQNSKVSKSKNSLPQNHKLRQNRGKGPNPITPAPRKTDIFNYGAALATLMLIIPAWRLCKGNRVPQRQLCAAPREFPQPQLKGCFRNAPEHSGEVLAASFLRRFSNLPLTSPSQRGGCDPLCSLQVGEIHTPMLQSPGRGRAENGTAVDASERRMFLVPVHRHAGRSAGRATSMVCCLRRAQSPSQEEEK